MGILLFLLVLIIVVSVHELGHFIAARYSKMHVEEFGIGFPPRAAKIGSYKGTPITLNWLPLGGFVKIAGEDGDTLQAIPEGKRRFGVAPKRLQALVLISGVLGNIILGIVLLSLSFMIGVPQALPNDVSGRIIAAEVVADSPAKRAGLQSGDHIVSINGKSVTTVDDTIGAISGTEAGQSVVLAVVRNNNEVDISITPVENKIGVMLASVETQKYGFFESIGKGIVRTGEILWGVIKGLGLLIAALFQGNREVLQSVSGPVGIATATIAAGKFGISYLFAFVALISLNLAVINLFPLPALDGGRLVVVGIEAITRRKISPKVMMWLNGIGFLLIILLIISVTIHDIRMLF